MSCTVKPAVYLRLGAEAAAPSGVCVLDVQLPFGKAVDVSSTSGHPCALETRLFQDASALQIEKIVFKNYYTASVTLRLLRRSPGQEAPARWCTALRDLALMENPHTEGGSQDYCCIGRAQVRPARAGGWGTVRVVRDVGTLVCLQMQVAPDHVTSVRLILRQPSSVWLSFKLEDVKIYPQSSCVSPAGTRWASTAAPFPSRSLLVVGSLTTATSRRRQSRTFPILHVLLSPGPGHGAL